MVNSTEIGLIPVQHQPQRNEPQDLTVPGPSHPTTPQTNAVDLHPSSSSPARSPLTENNPSPVSMKPDETSLQRQSQGQPQTSVPAPDVHPLGDAGVQVKRKRGRPRKYNYEPAFSSQIPSPSHRLSLPTNLPDVKPIGILAAESEAVEPAKKIRLGRPHAKSSSAPNGNISETPKNNLEIRGSVQNTNVNNGETSIIEAPIIETPKSQPQQLPPSKQHHHHHHQQQPTSPNAPVHQTAQQQSHEVVQIKHQSPTSNQSKVLTYPPQQPSTINGHLANGGINTSTTVNTTSGHSNPTVTIAASSGPLAPLAMKTTMLMDHYNSPFVRTHIQGPAAALVTHPPQPIHPAHFATAPVAGAPNPSMACSTVDIDLLQRLLPQVGAAVAATRAGGYPGPHTWTKEMVASFISMLPGCQNAASAFIENEIDGPALLVLGQQELMNTLKLKLGPSAKIAGAIRTLRFAFMSIPMNEFSADHAAVVNSANSRFSALTAASSTQTIASANASLIGGNISASFSINNLAIEERVSVERRSFNGNGDNPNGH
ncbi:hypothetical protein Aperf_G00000130257 [Anoplocephala perfoliata]